MGLRDRFKNRQGNDESQDAARNFMHLAKLLASKKYANLDCDIVIGGLEKRVYKHGMAILENTIVNGYGHTIDARGIARVFYINERDVVLEDITFINGYDENGGIIFVDKNGSVEIRDCTFKGNHATNLGGAIINFGNLTLENVEFIDNVSDMEGGAINNQAGANMSINNCSFRENNSQVDGGAIFNWGEITITESNFENNNANRHTGAIQNIRNGNLNISKTNFIKNTTNGDGGALNNNMESSNMKVDDCRFIDNRSGAGGGAVVNWGKSIINNSEFKGNFSKTRGYDINFQKGSLKLSNIRFNNIKEKSIFSTNDDLVTIENCEFIEYDE